MCINMIFLLYKKYLWALLTFNLFTFVYFSSMVSKVLKWKPASVLTQKEDLNVIVMTLRVTAHKWIFITVANMGFDITPHINVHWQSYSMDLWETFPLLCLPFDVLLLWLSSVTVTRVGKVARMAYRASSGFGFDLLISVRTIMYRL